MRQIIKLKRDKTLFNIQLSAAAGVSLVLHFFDCILTADKSCVNTTTRSFSVTQQNAVCDPTHTLESGEQNKNKTIHQKKQRV